MSDQISSRRTITLTSLPPEILLQLYGYVFSEGGGYYVQLKSWLARYGSTNEYLLAVATEVWMAAYLKRWAWYAYHAWSDGEYLRRKVEGSLFKDEIRVLTGALGKDGQERVRPEELKRELHARLELRMEKWRRRDEAERAAWKR